MVNEAGPVHPAWQNLLDWLATHGMDTSAAALPVQARASPDAGYGLFALKNLPRETQLISIPSSALLNMTTLSPLYPQAKASLTAIQLMSLHLFLFRPNDLQPSYDPAFGPYISTLPRDFDTHPLTWISSKKPENAGHPLLPNLPTSILASLREAADRFHDDWAIVKRYIQQNDFTLPIAKAVHSKIHALQYESGQCEEDFLWGWLNVNTRCLYYRLEQSPSDKNNVTLCPIIDFANHTVRSNHMSLGPSVQGKTKAPSKVFGHNFTLLSPSDKETKVNDELFLTYGAHSNQTLFIEYGFVNEVSNEVFSQGDLAGEISVQSIVSDLFQQRGQLGVWMKDVLRDEGYWGDWTLHSQPQPAHPSFRLITALRLYHLFPIAETRVPPDPDSALDSWKATILGTSENVSKDNDEAWRGTLLRICRDRTCAAKAYLEKDVHSDGPGWILWAIQNIRMLWLEEHFISAAVSNSILQNEEF